MSVERDPRPVAPAWQLDPASPQPLHRQFEQRVLEQVHSGAWKPGDKIPSERDLMRLADISRATVRQALGTLIHQGVLETAHGRGTFVRQPQFEQPLHIVYSFYEQLRSVGVTLRSEVLKCATIPAPSALAAQLNIEPGSRVTEIIRRRFIKNTPAMLVTAYVPYDICPGLGDDDLTTSLYHLLTDKYDLPVVRAVDRFEAMAATPDMATLLNVAKRFPMMHVERTAYTTDGAVLHVGLSTIRGDMCRFRSELLSQTSSLELKQLDDFDETEPLTPSPFAASGSGQKRLARFRLQGEG